MVVDCPLVIISKVKLFFRPDKTWKKEWMVQPVFCIVDAGSCLQMIRLIWTRWPDIFLLANNPNHWDGPACCREYSQTVRQLLKRIQIIWIGKLISIRRGHSIVKRMVQNPDHVDGPSLLLKRQNSKILATTKMQKMHKVLRNHMKLHIAFLSSFLCVLPLSSKILVWCTHPVKAEPGKCKGECGWGREA